MSFCWGCRCQQLARYMLYIKDHDIFWCIQCQQTKATVDPPCWYCTKPVADNGNRVIDFVTIRFAHWECFNAFVEIESSYENEST